jgi:hypothetical protein
MFFINWKQKYIEQRHKEEIYLEGLAIQASIFKRSADVRDKAWRSDMAWMITKMMVDYAKDFDLMDYLTELYGTYPELKERKEE